MRIALLCPYSLSRPGGVQGQVTGLARTLRGRGHHVVVLAPSDAPDGPELEREDFVSMGRSLPVPANGSVAPVSFSPAGFLHASQALRRRAFDIVHVHEPFVPGAASVWLLAANVPKVSTFHRAGAGVGYRLSGPLLRVLAWRLDARCAVSPAAEATAREVVGGDYEVLGNGVDIDRFLEADPWPKSGQVVMFVGRHEPRKGLDVLLHAWETSQIPPEATLWVVGDGPETQALKRRHPARPGLEWLGRLEDDELARRMAASDVVCAPSKGGESFGVVLVEAMAARSAVVASDLPGYAFVAGTQAYLVPPGDPTALSAALVRALDDARKSSGLCSKTALDDGVRRASRWTMGELATRYLAVYDRLVS